MTKLVLKTILITLLSIILFFVLLYGVLALFFPKTLAEGFYDLGAYNTSMHYYEKQYEKTESIDDLIAICNYCDESSDVSFSAKYLKLLVNDMNFDSICDGIDSSKKPQMSSKEFYYGKYAVATFYSKNVSDAVSICETFVGKYGYTSYNPYSSLIYSCLSGMSVQQKLAVKNSIGSVKSDLQGDALTYADRDYNLING